MRGRETKRLIGLGEAVVVIVLFVGLTLVLTWPSVLTATSRVIGNANHSDLYVGLWSVWWVPHALRHGIDVYVTDLLFHPYGASLVFHDLTVLLAVIAMPAQRFGLVFAYNVAVWATFVLSGLAAYGLGRELTGNRAGGWLAGAVFAFSSYRFAHLQGHLGLLGTFGLPAYAWSLVRIARSDQPSWGLIVLSGGLLGMNIVLHPVYFGFALLLGATFAVWLWWERSSVPFVARNIALPMVLGMAPVVGLVVLGIRSGALDSSIARSVASVRIFNGVSWRDFFTPSPIHSLWRPPVETWITDWTETTVYLGVVPLVLIAVSLRSILGSRLVPFFLLWGLLAAVLALEPVFRLIVRIAHQTVGGVWLLENMRVPTRFTLCVTLAVAVVAAHAWVTVIASWSARRAWLATFAITTCVLLEHLVVPLPLAALAPGPAFQRLRDVPGDFGVLRLPIGWGLDGVFDPSDLYDQTVHGKPMVGGYLARAPARVMSRLAAEPVIAAIRTMQGGGRSLEDGARAALALQGMSLAERWRLGAVIVKRRPGLSSLTGPAFEVDRLQAIARAVFPLELWYEDEDVLVYRVVGVTR